MANFPMPRKFFFKLQVFNKVPHFGKGVISLMLLIRQGHSLRAACKEMGISYSKAWKLVKAAEDDMGFPLMEGTKGGVGGGGSQLSPQGQNLLSRYLLFENAAQKSMESLFQEYFGDEDPT